MVLGWRKAFCTSISRSSSSSNSTTMEQQQQQDHGYDDSISTTNTPKFTTRFTFFTSSNPSTPRLRCRTTTTTATSHSAPLSPKLHHDTPRLLLRSSTPSSPRSPSPFSFLKSGLRLHTRRCGLCLQSVKKGNGTASFTAECCHTFHFLCISDHVKKQGSLACPLCSCLWKEMPMLTVDDQNQNLNYQNNQFVDEVIVTREKLATRFVEDDVIGKNESPKRKMLRSDLKVYNDDEPLASLTPKARFNPIPESDENDEDEIEQFRGFCVNDHVTNVQAVEDVEDVEVRLLPEAAVIAASRRHETYAIVLKVKAPSPVPEKLRRRSPVDLVTVVDVSSKITNEKLLMIKKAMRSIILSLSSSDRLSIVAFSSYSKRLLPLKRMTTNGRRSARRIVEAMAVIDGFSNSKDAVKKSVKVLEDRREKNPFATVILLSDVVSSVSSVRCPHSRIDIPIHSVNIAVTENFVQHIGNLLTVTVQDLRLNLGFLSGSSPAEITAVYSRTPYPIVLGSSTVRIGDLSAGEERELLVELKVPLSTCRSHRVLSVHCCYNKSGTCNALAAFTNALLVPRPTTVKSSSIQRLRNLFISTRALAESRRLTERNDVISAYHILVSARALMQQNSACDNEFMVGLEAELSQVQRRRKLQASAQQPTMYRDEKGEPLTPTSAWRVADKLAKVAMMRKSVNRVSDLHGFEDARF